MKRLLCLLVIIASVSAFAQTSYTWNGTTSSAWNVATNWTPNGVPGTADNVTIVTGSNPCNVVAATSITNFTLTSGTLNLGGFVLTATGNALFTAGNVNNGTLTVNAGTANTITLTNPTFASSALLNVTTGAITLNGGTYGGAVSFTQTGSTNPTGTGNATFNGTLSIINNGAGYYRTNGNCTFNGNVTITNNGTGSSTAYVLLELTTGNTYNGNVTIVNNSSVANVRMCYMGATAFNGNILLNNTNTGNVIFGEQSTATGTLAAGKTIAVGGTGFSNGVLYLYRFTQSGSTAQSLTFTGSALCQIDNNTTFNGAFTLSAPSVYISNTTFNSTASITKTGAYDNNWAGGNTFNGDLTINQTTATNNYLALNASGNNTYNGNVTISNSATNGVYLPNGSGSSTLAAGKTITATSFTAGNLYLKNFTQLGSTAQNLTVTGAAVIQSLTSTWNGAVSFTAPHLYITGSTFNSAFTVTKTGAGSSQCGGNTYASTANITNSGSGYLMFGLTTPDVFNGDVTITNNGSERVIMAYNCTGNQFNGNVILNQSGSATGIYLGFSSTSGVTLASGKTVTQGTTGIIASSLSFIGFTQAGSTAQAINLSGSTAVVFSNNCILNGPWTITSPDIYVQGATFNSPVIFNKTGGTYNHNNGNLNIFNGTCTINQTSSTGYFMLGYNSTDQFNDNVIVTSTAAGGINLGWSGGTGQPTLANGKTLTVGGAGFNAGYLRLGCFQAGTSPVNLTLTGSAYFVSNSTTSGNSVFNGSVSVTAPDIYLQGNMFNAPSTFIKTGGTYNHNSGYQNIFNGTVEINNQSNSGYFMLSYQSADQFNDNIIVNSTGTGGINLGYSSGTCAPVLAAGKTISIGSSGFTSGTLYFGHFTQLGSAAISLPMSSAGSGALSFGFNSSFGGAITYTAPTIYFNTTTFAGSVTGLKTGITNDASAGGNTFNGAFNITNTGTGYFLMGNGAPDIFNGASSWINQSTGQHMYLAYSSTGNIFNGDVTLTNQSSIYTIYANQNSAGTQYNGNITVNNTSTGTIYFGQAAVSSATLATGKNISIGGSGFTNGGLIFKNFYQFDNSVSINLTTTSGSYIQFGPSSTFSANVTTVSPGLVFSGCTFGGTTNCTKNGSTNDQGTGGNTFNGTSTITNAGSGYLMLGNGTADTWNADVTFNNTGSYYMYLAYNSTGNMYNGNITVNASSTALGINFCAGSAATATLSAGKTIQTGSGYDGGYLILQRFTQLGNAPVNLTFGATAANLNFGPSSAFGGNVTSSSPQLYFHGCTFSGTTNCTKTGAVDNASNGGNTFTGASTITNSGSGYLLLGNGTADQFLSTATFNNTGSYRIYFAHNHPGQTTTFGGNVLINAAKTGGSDGWSYLIADNNNTSVSFGGNVTYSVSGAVQSNVRILTGTGGTATYAGNVVVDVPNTNASTQVQLGNYGTSVYNGNITVTNSGGAYGVYFNLNVPASSTLAATKVISIGSAGFNAGTLSLIRFTQLGSTPQALTLTGTGSLISGPSSAFGGNVNFLAPQVYLNGCTYSGTATIEKNGANDNAGTGGNIFNGTTILTNSGSGYLMTGNTTADAFNASTTFNNTGSYRFYFAHNHGGQTTSFASDLTLNSAKSAGTDGWSYFMAEGNNVNVTFGGPVTMNCSGSIPSNFRLLLGTSSTATYSNDVSINVTNNNSSTALYMGAAGTSAFNGNLSVVNNAGASGIYFNTGAAATSTLSAGKTITVGAGGFNSGVLSLVRFIQAGSTAQSLTLTGTGNLTFGPGAAFGGNVTCVSPTLYFHGCTYSGTTNCTKNGSTNDPSNGSNVFTGVSTINNSGSGYLLFGNLGNDQWLTDVTYNNTGSSYIYTAHNSAGNVFGGNVTCNNVGSTGNNTGIYMCASANSSATITGNLVINNNSASGTNNGIRFAEGNTSTVTVVGTSTITNTSTNPSNYIRFAAGTGAVSNFNGDVTVNNNGSAAATNVVHFGYTGSSAFGGNITLNSNGGTGIYFGASAGTSTQANNKTINTSTFSGGNLYIRNFTQSGPAAGNNSNVSITGTNMLLSFNNSSFYDNVTGSSQQIDCITSTFRGTSALTKTGGNANNYWTGGNTFNGTATITNQSPTYVLGMANGTADTYNGDVNFVQSSTGVLSPNYNANCSYLGSITLTSPAASTITLGSAAGGIATMTGTGSQTITVGNATTPYPNFTRLVMNKASNAVTLGTRINVVNTLTMTAGTINTTSVNILNMNDASTTTVGNSSSYINGPMNYDMKLSGSRTLNFPIGKASDWRPVVLALTHSNSTSYTYNSELFNAQASQLAWTLPATVDTISGVHWWDINRYLTGGTVSTPTAGLSGNQTITIYFGTNDDVRDGANLTICKNTYTASASWIDIGGTGAPAAAGGAQLSGSIQSTSSPSAFNSFSRFTLGSKLAGYNPLPVELLYFTADAVNDEVRLNWSTATETNNKDFEIERSSDGKNFEPIGFVSAYGDGNSQQAQIYKSADAKPLAGNSYYRLKQVDKNGNHSYSNLAQVDLKKRSFVKVFPNPATDNIFISASSDYEQATAKIIDELGREVLSVKVYTGAPTLISTASLAPGMYYILVDNGAGINKTKITVQ